MRRHLEDLNVVQEEKACESDLFKGHPEGAISAIKVELFEIQKFTIRGDLAMVAC